MEMTNQDKILNAAEKRMLQFGYRKVTMDEIAGDLRMSKNTIYKEFKSKIEIAEFLLNRLKNKINTYQIKVEKESADPLEILSKNTFYLQKELAPWFKHFLIDIKFEVPLLWEDFVDYRTEKILEIENLIKKGIKKKKFRKVNPTLAARAYLGAVNSIITPEVLEQEGVSFQSALEFIMDIWSEGILYRK
ncbi:MAG: TetR/AcrR family transcriptional regulator [Candidatus Omnitrophica bacterium]|nr:TetR/AcrR family transcriptional regulator [Candidatus Omnitrophota bacterium]